MTSDKQDNAWAVIGLVVGGLWLLGLFAYAILREGAIWDLW